MKARFSWLLGLFALVAAFALPVQALAQELNETVVVADIDPPLTVSIKADTEQVLPGLSGVYKGDGTLVKSDTPAKGYSALATPPGSYFWGSVEFPGGAQNFLIEAWPQAPGSVHAMYVEYADGTTEVKRHFLTDDILSSLDAWFVIDKPAVRCTFVEETFMDSAVDMPHADDVIWLASNGISTGFPDGTFRPYDKVARCDMAAFLRRQAQVMGVEGADTWKPSEKDWAKFSDIKKDTPHAEDVLWLASTGISTGFADGTFKPYDKVARCDMAAFLYRLYSLKTTGEVTDVQAGAGENPFKDVNGDTPHAQEVLWLASTGVSKGFPDGTFKSFDKVARCDMAAFLHRLYDATA